MFALNNARTLNPFHRSIVGEAGLKNRSDLSTVGFKRTAFVNRSKRRQREVVIFFNGLRSHSRNSSGAPEFFSKINSIRISATQSDAYRVSAFCKHDFERLTGFLLGHSARHGTWIEGLSMQIMDAKLNTRLPAHVMGAIKIVASKRRLRASAYIRQIVLAHLIVEGAVSREQVETAEDPAIAVNDPDMAPGQWRYEWLRKRGLV